MQDFEIIGIQKLEVVQVAQGLLHGLQQLGLGNTAHFGSSVTTSKMPTVCILSRTLNSVLLPYFVKKS